MKIGNITQNPYVIKPKHPPKLQKPLRVQSIQNVSQRSLSVPVTKMQVSPKYRSAVSEEESGSEGTPSEYAAMIKRGSSSSVEFYV